MSGRCSVTAGLVRAMITPQRPDGELASSSHHVVATGPAHISGYLRVGRCRIPEVQDHEREVMVTDRGRIGRCARKQSLVAEVIRIGPSLPGNFGAEVISLDVVIFRQVVAWMGANR